MTATRFVFQAREKIKALCTVMQRAGELASADANALADAAGIPQSTLKSAVQRGRFSPELEDKLSQVGRFDHAHHSWVDDAVPEAMRRDKPAAQYNGRDTLELFRLRLAEAWESLSVCFRATPRSYSAFDPHMVRHELSDMGQSTAAGASMQFFLSAHFEPVHHRSGIAFGFRKAAVMVQINCRSGARASERLGHPQEASLGDARLQGEAISRHLRWTIGKEGGDGDMLAGEYSTSDQPLFCLADYEDGTAVISQIDVNLYDRATFATEGELDVSLNKQALIEQIFLQELPTAEARNGWITISRQELVVGRYG